MLHTKIFKNFSLLTFSNVIQQGLNFIVLIPMARILEPEGYGTYTIILAIVTIAQAISSLGIRQIIIREIARNPQDVSSIAWRSFVLSVAGFFLTCLLLIPYFIIYEGVTNPTLLIISIFLLLSQVIWNFAEPLAFGKEKMEFSSVIGSVFTILWVGVIIFILPEKYFNLTSVLVIYTLIQLMRSLVYLLFEWKENYFKRNKIRNQSQNAGIIELFTRSLPLYASTLLNIPVVQLPVLFLGKNSGTVEVAYFGLGSKLSLPFALIAGNLISAIYPLLARLYKEDRTTFEMYTKKFLVTLWFIGLCTCFELSLFSREIVKLMFGLKYEAAVPA